MKRFKIHTILLLAVGLFTLCSSQAATTKLRLLTFNVLNAAQNDSTCPWNNRFTQICINLHKIGADIMALQDVNPAQLADLRQGLPEYEVVPTLAVSDSTAGLDPVFYNKSELKLVGHGFFWLSDTPDQCSTSWDIAKPQSVCWCVFQDIVSGNSFILANTQCNNFGEQARFNSAILLKTNLGKMSNGTPVILTGSLDISDKKISYSTLLTRIFPLKDAWTTASRKNGGPATTNDFDKQEPQRSDFILTTEDIESKEATVLSTRVSKGHYLSSHDIYWAELKWK